MTNFLEEIAAAQKEQLEDSAKDLPEALENLLGSVDGNSLIEDNGRVKLVPVETIKTSGGTDVAIPSNLGILMAIRQLSESDFSKIAIGLVKKEYKLNLTSYADSGNTYMSLTTDDDGPHKEEKNPPGRSRRRKTQR